jgi:signal transduction histidine kinase/AraC-like DNA-binding protein
MDSYQGMQAVVRHLIQTHGLRRLAFVRGPENHHYAQERYRAYVETLQEQRLPRDPNLVTPPLQWEAGAEAIHILLDERGLRPGRDLQAIVTVSDLAALGALRALHARGIQVPDDLALTGFNDSAEGRLTIPPLTSVSMPFHEQGERAIEMLVMRLAGQPIPQQMVLPTRLVVRQSCGCPDQAMVLADLPPVSPGRAGSARPLAALRREATDEIARVMGAAEETHAAIAQLVDALLLEADLKAEGKTGFLPTLERVLRSNATGHGDVSAWHDAISILRRHCLPRLDSTHGLAVENLVGQARVLIGGTAQRTQALEQLQAERQAEALRELGQGLITTFDAARLADMLAERLPAIGIASCYLALYEKPALESCRLILAYTEQGRVDLGAAGRRFPSRHLVPFDLLPQRRQYSFVVEPLYFQHEQIGFAVFEVGPRDGAIYELLRAQISSALKGALLLQEAQQARQMAEKADRIKTRLLANVSHELRTPLNIILGYSQDALGALDPYGITPPQALLDDLEHIRSSADHQLRVVNDLLDLSRAEIDELDLYLELLAPRPLLQDAFQSIVHAAVEPAVTWHLKLPERLPSIQADPVRLRQILLNLLSNARRFTDQGEVVLGAQVETPHLHLWVQDTGAGISPDMQERIFEPFVTAEHAGRRPEGIGLGLSITRRLVALHGGSMKLESQPGRGSTFHVYLPLPNLADKTAPVAAPAQPVLLLIAATDQPAAEIIELSQHQGLAIQRLRASDDSEAVLSRVQPAALAWDLAGASSGDWAMVRRLRNHPRLSQSPFILYGQGESAQRSSGLTSVVVKPPSTSTLLGAINALCPKEITGPILIVDDDPAACQAHQDVIAQGLPGYPVCAVNDGAAALAALQDQVPSLVLLDLMMPEMDGFDVLDRLRADPRTQAVPVVILTNKVLNLDDIKRIERHTRVIVQSKGVLADDEIIAALHRALFGAEALPPQTSALVKRAVAYIHQNYARPLARWEIAEAIGVSENYLSRVFIQELGLAPWDYLNRFRVSQAKALFRRTQGSVKSVAAQVGFKDQKYFSRVFHKLTGLSPNEYREQPRS